jgi:hypothetical protein
MKDARQLVARFGVDKREGMSARAGREGGREGGKGEGMVGGYLTKRKGREGGREGGRVGLVGDGITS